MPKKGQRTAKVWPGDASDVTGFVALCAAYFEALRVQTTPSARSRAATPPARVCEMGARAQPRAAVGSDEADFGTLSAASVPSPEKEQAAALVPLQHGCLVPVRALFKWLCRHNHLLANPAADLDLPRAESGYPSTCSPPPRPSGARNARRRRADGLRDRAILEAFYSTGMRRMELMGLKLYDLDQERGTVFIRQGKGKKDRMIPMGERAFSWVMRYVEERVHPSP